MRSKEITYYNYQNTAYSGVLLRITMGWAKIPIPTSMAFAVTTFVWSVASHATSGI